MDTLLVMTKNLCAFVLLTTVINNLLQESKYRKYIRYFAGLVIFIMILNPVLNVLSMDFDMDKLVSEYVYEAELPAMNDDTEYGSLMSEYKERLDLELSKILEKYDMTILESTWHVEDRNEEEYGIIKGLEADISLLNPADINDIRIDESGNVSVEAEKDEIIAGIESAFGLSREMIDIEIVE